MIACCSVHRMGQVRDCHIQRLIIRDTIEDRLLDIQSRKSVLVRSCTFPQPRIPQPLTYTTLFDRLMALLVKVCHIYSHQLSEPG